MTMRRSLRLSFLFLGLPLAACSGSDTSRELTATSSDAILNGTTVTVAEQQVHALVTVNGGSCSGILLSNDWALTAGHCLAYGPGNQAANSVTLNRSTGSDTRTSDQFYQFGDYELNSAPDIAVIHLSSPMPVNGSTTGFTNAIDATPSSSLLGVTLAEYGIGYNQINPNSGAGSWRAADMVVSGSGGNELHFNPNSSNRIAWLGDSGGPYLRWINGAPFVVGIQSSASFICPPTGPCNTSTATGVAEAQAVSLGDRYAWIAAVFKTTWNANLSAQAFDVYQDEINGTYWSFSDVNSANWAQAMRAATQISYARAFSGAHFDGQTVSGRDGVLFEGPGTASLVFTQIFVDTSAEPFTDLNAIGWAQANREAGSFCYSQGYVSGHFDGYQDAGSSYGVICANSNARYYVATASDFASAGWPMGDVDSTPWAAAERSATAYCTARGFAGGYLNGNETRTNSTYGVICER
jgi:hypothetical protein